MDGWRDGARGADAVPRRLCPRRVGIAVSVPGLDAGDASTFLIVGLTCLSVVETGGICHGRGATRVAGLRGHISDDRAHPGN